MRARWLMLLTLGVGCAPKDRIAPVALAGALAVEPSRYVVVDVRSDGEWRGNKGHIPGALHRAWPGIKETAGQLPVEPDQTIVLVCYTGHRSRWSMAAVRRAHEGVEVVDLDGGMIAWWAYELPTEAVRD